MFEGQTIYLFDVLLNINTNHIVQLYARVLYLENNKPTFFFYN